MNYEHLKSILTIIF